MVCDPPPQPICKPSQWQGDPIDTSIAFGVKNGYLFSLKPVQRVNSPDDEWQMSFLDDKRALLTFSERGRQSAMLTRKIRHDSYDIEAGVINPIDMHTGALSISHAKAVFAASPRETAKSDTNLSSKIPVNMDFTGKSRIYEARIFGRELSEVRRVTEIESDDYSWDSQPALAPDGSAMIFTSDRDGGVGYADLWFSLKKSDGSWTNPVHLSSGINSTCDDLTPYITKDGKFLLFASAGFESVGGYDLFKSEISKSFYQDLKSNKLDTINIGKYFSKPENMKPPINSEYDELFPTSPGDIDSLLYFSSDRAGKENMVVILGGFDIYVFCKEKYSRLLAEQSKKQSGPDISLKPDDVTMKEP
ncbi:MAG: hypothetical protein K8F30_03075, partial [Taibaiella sp.]|nr:hypothetical protein [Taibaiella sp.]